MASYHPPLELLTAYASGTLPLSHSLGIAAHIECCPKCAATVQRLNQLGGSLFDQQKPSECSIQLKETVLAQLDEQAPVEASEEIPAVDVKIAKALRQFFPEAKDYESLNWNRLSPSLKMINLATESNGTKVDLIRIKAGGKVASHTHTGNEYTIILEGSFSDESGVYKEGDFIARNGRHHHRPVATEDRPCVCLAITEAPIQFTGFFTRWLNPFIR